MMAELEAYLIAAARGPLQSLSARPHIEQVQPILDELLKTSGAPARRVQEIHWHGGGDEYWLSGLGETYGFANEMARFFWPVTPLLAHTLLHLTARVLISGERELVILAQETGEQAAALLLASPAAVGRYNLVPRARVGAKLALSSTPNGLLAAARAALESAGQEMGDVRMLAAARRINTTGDPFPGAQWISPGPELPSGDFFLLAELVKRLEQEKQQCGLLISTGPQKSGLVTLLERVV